MSPCTATAATSNVLDGYSIQAVETLSALRNESIDWRTIAWSGKVCATGYQYGWLESATRFLFTVQIGAREQQQGIVHNYDDSTTLLMPELWHRTVARDPTGGVNKYNFSSWVRRRRIMMTWGSFTCADDDTGGETGFVSNAGS